MKYMDYKDAVARVPKKESREAGKGSKPRDVVKEKFDKNYDNIKWKSKKK